MSVPYNGVISPREGGPVLYGEQETPFSQDRVIWGFIVATWILVLAFFVPYLSFFGQRNKKKAIANTAIFVSLYVGCVIMVCQYGKDWQGGFVVTRTPYAAFYAPHINAQVGLHIGFRGINVTLIGVPLVQNNRTIDFNEEFSWEWQQGNTGFGIYGSRFTREYFHATEKGVPLPILQVAEWFTLEGEYIHWARYFRYAGWYCQILLWIALVCWGVTNILFVLSVDHAALGTISTGTVMVLANIVWAGLYNKNQNPLVITFEDQTLNLSYGWSYWLCLGTGIFCIFAGGIFYALRRWPQTRKIMEDITQDYATTQSRFVSSRNLKITMEEGEDSKIVEMENIEKKEDDGKDSDEDSDEDSDDDDDDDADSKDMKSDAKDMMVSENLEKKEKDKEASSDSDSDSSDSDSEKEKKKKKQMKKKEKKLEKNESEMETSSMVKEEDKETPMTKRKKHLKISFENKKEE